MTTPAPPPTPSRRRRVVISVVVVGAVMITALAAAFAIFALNNLVGPGDTVADKEEPPVSAPGGIPDLSGAVEALADNLRDVTAEVADLSRRVEGLTAGREAEQGRVDRWFTYLQRQDEGLAARQGALETALGGVQEATNILREEVVESRERLDALEDDLADLGDSVDARMKFMWARVAALEELGVIPPGSKSKRQGEPEKEAPAAPVGVSLAEVVKACRSYEAAVVSHLGEYGQTLEEIFKSLDAAGRTSLWEGCEEGLYEPEPPPPPEREVVEAPPPPVGPVFDIMTGPGGRRLVSINEPEKSGQCAPPRRLVRTDVCWRVGGLFSTRVRCKLACQ